MSTQPRELFPNESDPLKRAFFNGEKMQNGTDPLALAIANTSVPTSPDSVQNQSAFSAALAAIGFPIFVSGLVAGDATAAAANYTAIQAALDLAESRWNGSPTAPIQTVVLPAGKIFQTTQTVLVGNKTIFDLNGSTLQCASTGANGFPLIRSKNSSSSITSVVASNTGAANPAKKAWTATTAYAIGDHINVGDYVWQVIKAGTTGTTAPWMDQSGTVSAVTRANPAVVTETGHTRKNGEVVYFPAVTGMTQISGSYYVVANVTTNTYQLRTIGRQTSYAQYLVNYVNGGSNPTGINAAYAAMYPLVDSSAFGALTGTPTAYRVNDAAQPIAGNAFVDGTVRWQCLGKGSCIVTATKAAHNRLFGDCIEISGATALGFNGSVIITNVIDADHFQYLATAPVTNATTESTGLLIRGDRDQGWGNGVLDCQYPTLAAVSDGPAAHASFFENTSGIFNLWNYKSVNVSKYGVYGLHWQNIRGRNLSTHGAVVVFQFEGPGGYADIESVYGEVQGVPGNTSDDITAFGAGFTTAAYPAQIQGIERHTYGDIYSMHVRDVNPTLNEEHIRFFATTGGRHNNITLDNFSGYSDTNLIGFISDSPTGQGACFIDSVRATNLRGFSPSGDVVLSAPNGRLANAIAISGTCKIYKASFEIDQGTFAQAMTFSASLPQGDIEFVSSTFTMSSTGDYPIGIQASSDLLAQDIRSLTFTGGSLNVVNDADQGMIQITDGATASGHRIRAINFSNFNARSSVFRKGALVDAAYGLAVDAITLSGGSVVQLRSILDGQYQSVVRTALTINGTYIEDTGRICRTQFGCDVQVNCVFRITSANSGNYGDWGVFWPYYDGSHAVNTKVVGELLFFGNNPFTAMANSVAGHTLDINSSTITADPSLNTIILPTKNNRCISVATGTNKQGLALAVNGTNWYALGTGASGANTII